MTVEVRHQAALDLLGSLAAGSVAAIVTDPPFGVSYQSNRRADGKTRPVAGDWQVPITTFFAEVGRVLRDGGACYVCSRWDVLPSWGAAVAPPLKLRNVIAWDKGVHTAGDLAGNFGFRWEAILFITKGRHALRGKRWSNLWQIPRVPPGKWTVPTEKPVELFRRCVEASTDPGDLVADPFCGSGTLGLAAMACGRAALLGDVDEAMVQIALGRNGLAPMPHVARVPTTPPALCEDALDGLHPEDIRAVAEYLRERHAAVLTPLLRPDHQPQQQAPDDPAAHGGPDAEADEASP